MNTRIASALTLSLVAALAADAAASSTSTSSTEKSPVSAGQLILSNSTSTGYSGTTSFVRTTGAFYLGSSSGLQAGPPQAAPLPVGTLQLDGLKFDQKLDPITAIQATGIQRAAPLPPPKPEPQ